jgi:hypothetical protein
MLDEDGRAGRAVERLFAGWFRFMFGSADGGGNRDLSGIPSCGVKDMGAKTPGWRRGQAPKPRSGAAFPQGFTRDDKSR